MRWMHPAIILALSLLVVSACGRKAPLDPPSVAAGNEQGADNDAKTPKPDRPFFLDPLI